MTDQNPIFDDLDPDLVEDLTSRRDFSRFSSSIDEETSLR